MNSPENSPFEENADVETDAMPTEASEAGSEYLLDAKDVLALQNGDEQAFTNLWNRYSHLTYATILKVVKNRPDADDVQQKVWMKVMRKIDGLHEPERFKGWVRQIAFREAIRFFTNKRDAREVQVSDQKSVDGVPTETQLRWLNDGNSRDPLSILERSTDADCVQLAVLKFQNKIGMLQLATIIME